MLEDSFAEFFDCETVEYNILLGSKTAIVEFFGFPYSGAMVILRSIFRISEGRAISACLHK